MSVPSGALRAGVLLNDQYRLERVLGSGSMGVVWAARHEPTRAPVAVKIMSPERAGDERMVRRFLREARATAKLRGEHVARVYDAGTLPDGAPFLVMELLDGASLLRHLRDRGALPFSESVAWVLQACEALGEAHALGIVHRDLKPENLFLVRRPDGSRLVKVLDFGIAKRLPGPLFDATEGGGPSSSFDTTGEGSPLGSLGYMAPEQIADPSKVDARADVWALGVVLYELLSGRRPFLGASLPETITRVLQAAPPPLLDLCPGLPPGLAPVVARCLEKDRERRFPTVGALARALAPFRAPEACPALPPAPAATGPPRQPPLAPPSVAPGQATLLPLVTSQELIYPTRGDQAPGGAPAHGRRDDVHDTAPSSQFETFAAPTLREPPRFPPGAGSSTLLLPPMIELSSTPRPPTRERAPAPAGRPRGGDLAHIRETIPLAPDPARTPFSPAPAPSPAAPPPHPSAPAPEARFLTPAPGAFRAPPPPYPVPSAPPPASAPRERPARTIGAPLITIVLVVATLGSALLTVTLARQCSNASLRSTAPAAPSASTAPPASTAPAMPPASGAAIGATPKSPPPRPADPASSR